MVTLDNHAGMVPTYAVGRTWSALDCRRDPPLRTEANQEKYISASSHFTSLRFAQRTGFKINVAYHFVQSN
jgi:hypothetical protein